MLLQELRAEVLKGFEVFPRNFFWEVVGDAGGVCGVFVRAAHGHRDAVGGRAGFGGNPMMGEDTEEKENRKYYTGARSFAEIGKWKHFGFRMC